MAPRRFSRFTFASGFADESGAFMLEDPEPFLFVDRADSRSHSVGEGDTLWSLAAQYFPSFPRLGSLWWIIADFQPDPIVDPTVKLVVGTQLVIPSERVVTEEIFNEARRREVIED